MPDIPIRDICEKAEISESTFYNYFPQKIDLINYIVSLYNRRRIFETNNKVSDDDPIKWINVYFENTIDIMIEMENLSNEVLATIIRERVKPEKIQVTKLEFFYMFPEKENIEAFQSALTIKECFDEIVEKLVKRDLLKSNIDSIDVSVALKIIMGGIPLISALYGDDKLKSIVRKQISLVLQGVLK
jgi:AcrR family transcriptional regulator